MPSRKKSQHPRPSNPPNSSSSSNRAPAPAAHRPPAPPAHRPPSTSAHRPPAPAPWNQPRPPQVQPTWNQQSTQPIWEWDSPSAQFTWNQTSQATWNQMQQATWNQNPQSTWISTPQELACLALEDWLSPPPEWGPLESTWNQSCQASRNQPNQATRNRQPNQATMNQSNQATWNQISQSNQATWIQPNQATRYQANQGMRNQTNPAIRNRNLGSVPEEEPVPARVPKPVRHLEAVFELVQGLLCPELRAEAMEGLCNRADIFHYLGPIIWQSFAIVTALLQEIIIVYPFLYPPNLNKDQSLRVYRAVTLLQCIATHPETRIPFLHSHLHIFLYPFLNTQCKDKIFDALRVSTLGVIGGLIKGEGEEQKEVILFYLQSEFVPLCLRTIEIGGDTSSMVATFILKKILMDELGLEYVCQTAERFISVCGVLQYSFETLADYADDKMVRFLVRCYLYLSVHPRMAHHMRDYLPKRFFDGFLVNYYLGEPELEEDIYQILYNINSACLKIDPNMH